MDLPLILFLVMVGFLFGIPCGRGLQRSDDRARNRFNRMRARASSYEQDLRRFQYERDCG